MDEKILPKIYIGIVTFKQKDYCAELLSKSIAEYNYDKKLMKIGVCDNSIRKNNIGELSVLPTLITKYADMPVNTIMYNPEKDEPVRQIIANSRNLLRLDFLKSDCDYFFSLESDVILPPDCLNKLISHNKKVISAVNVHTFGIDANKPIALTDKNSPISGVSRNLEWTDLYDFSQLKEKNITANELLELPIKEDPMKISGCGLGCILISREVLERTAFGYHLNKPIYDDMIFCEDVKNFGYDLYLCPEIVAMHFQGGWEGLRK